MWRTGRARDRGGDVVDQEEVDLRQLREQGHRGEGLFLRGWRQTHPGVDDAQLL